MQNLNTLSKRLFRHTFIWCQVYLFLYFFIGLIPSLYSQQFTEISVEITGVIGGSIQWGDFDNDSDLDLLLNSKLYRNDRNNVFVNLNVEIEGGHSVWFDMDNDNDLDIQAGSNLYRNNGNGSFIKVDSVLQLSAHTFGDFDSDGDIDIITGGGIYVNDPIGQYRFESSNIWEIGSGSFSMGDSDLDMDLDLLICGKDINGNRTAFIQVNEGYNNFNTLHIGLSPVEIGRSLWWDYNNDGRLDIINSGDYDACPVTDIHRNNIDGSFLKINANIAPIGNGDVTWGDFNNDGLSDILLTGTSISPDWIPFQYTGMYLNQDFDTFKAVQLLEQDFYNGRIAVGDYDSDGDLDFILAGYDDGTGRDTTRLFSNNESIPNLPPSIPTGLTSKSIGNKIILQWNRPLDNETPSS